MALFAGIVLRLTLSDVLSKQFDLKVFNGFCICSGDSPLVSRSLMVALIDNDPCFPYDNVFFSYTLMLLRYICQG